MSLSPLETALLFDFRQAAQAELWNLASEIQLGERFGKCFAVELHTDGAEVVLRLEPTARIAGLMPAGAPATGAEPCASSHEGEAAVERDGVERVTISLTKALRSNPKVQSLQKLKRFSAYVEGLITADLQQSGHLRERELHLRDERG